MKENNVESKKASNLLNDFKVFFTSLINLEHDTDKTGTVTEIKSNISMQGHTAWILVFSIIIASIGLNVSSTAVVIGAMLISPLMGPILGIGLSIGINDVDTLRRSLVNLAVMVILSLVTSSLFFSIPLFNDATPEILARTQPDVRDVLIAIAGGLALIVAISRPSPQTNTVAGVAIATALMPPLCTAGFGIGTGNLEYFAGAMFLFTINTIFIALSTFVIVKFLNFPMVKYINSKKKKRISRVATFVATVVLAFSIYSFYTLFKENQFKKEAKNFIQDLKNNGVSIIGDDDKNINYNDKTITIYVFGNMVQSDVIDTWNSDLKEHQSLKNATLNVKQEDDSEINDKVKNLTELYAQNQKIISSRDESIQSKEEKINLLEAELLRITKNEIPFSQICKEIKISYTGVENISYAMEMNSDFIHLDTVSVFNIHWFDSIPEDNIITENESLKLWLQTRLELDTLVLNIR